MYRHVQTVFTVLALDLVGILTFLQKPSRSLNAAARDSATERGVAAMMIGAAGAGRVFRRTLAAVRARQTVRRKRRG